MAEHHRIDASGTEIKEVTRSLGSQRGNLVKKFKEAGVSVDIKIAEAHFTAEYSLKGKCKNSACTTQFRVESDKSWEALLEKAQKVSDLGSYNTNYSAIEFLALTLEQKKVIEPGRAPAGYSRREGSALDSTKILTF